jgi:DNA polymerase I
VCDCGRLHPDFRIHASVTGRLSEPIMTVPKPKVGRPNLRDLVIAPPGYVLLEADYKAGELMVVAALSGDEKMREAIFAGVDLHDALMRDLGMLTKEQYVEKLGPDDGVKEYETQRRSAKVINFGVIYGMEANLLSIILGIEEWEAELFLERYWEVRQGVRRWMDDVHKQAWTTGVLETPFGRRRRYGLVSDETRKKIGREAGNLFPQSILTDCMLESTVEFMDVTTVRDNHVILFYHDSITAEVPETEDVVGVAAGLRAIMQDVPKRRLKTDIPFDADFKVGTRWGSLKALKID